MFVLSLIYLLASIIYLFESRFIWSFLYAFAGIWFLYTAILNRTSYFNKYILFSDDKIEIKKSIFKSSVLLWDKITSIKSSSSSIEFNTENGKDTVLSLDWMDYPVAKEIKQVLAEFCSAKNIQLNQA